MIKKVFNFIIYTVIFMIIIMLIYFLVQKNLSEEKYTNIFGYTFLEVVTGSMSGTIEIGDGVIVQLTTDVEKDDIIVYKKDGMLITHRLIEKNNDVYITKGDANNVQDEPITEDMIIGKVINIIPHINAWKILLFCMVLVFLIIFIVIRKAFC